MDTPDLLVPLNGNKKYNVDQTDIRTLHRKKTGSYFLRSKNSYDIPAFKNTLTPTLLILVGPDGSGKTKFAQKHIDTSIQQWVRVSLEDMRHTAIANWETGGYYDRPRQPLESQLVDLMHHQILFFLNQKVNVIVDGTHLKVKHLLNYVYLYNHLADIKMLTMTGVTLENCIQKSLERHGPNYPIDKLEKAFEHYADLLGKECLTPGIELNMTVPKHNNLYPKKNPDLPECIVVDIDGCICDASHRHIFDESKICLDKPIIPMRTLVQRMKTVNQTGIVYMTARSEKYRTETQKWLDDNGFPVGMLIMKQDDDFRPDYAVKGGLYKLYIEKYFNVLFAIEDNLEIIEHCWKKLDVFIINPMYNK
jgi:predicted kinase